MRGLSASAFAAGAHPTCGEVFHRSCGEVSRSAGRAGGTGDLRSSEWRGRDTSPQLVRPRDSARATAIRWRSRLRPGIFIGQFAALIVVLSGVAFAVMLVIVQVGIFLGMLEGASITIERLYLPQKTKQSQIFDGPAKESASKLVEKLRFEARVI